ncbi:MAG: hypothetical protein ACOY94_09525 [Bacillota bacterium]
MSVDPTRGSPFPGLKFAGELDDLQDLKEEITMNEDWTGYLNQLVLNKLNENHPGRLSHLRFLPDPSTGIVILVPAQSPDEYGATEIRYTETENGALVNLRRAVQRLKVQKLAGRIRVFPVVARTAPDGKTYLAFVVKNSKSRPARKLKPGEQAAAGVQSTPE